VDNIGEQDGDLLVFCVDVTVVDWCAATVAEPGVL
jgi:hypothetical protein